MTTRVWCTTHRPDILYDLLDYNLNQNTSYYLFYCTYKNFTRQFNWLPRFASTCISTIYLFLPGQLHIVSQRCQWSTLPYLSIDYSLGYQHPTSVHKPLPWVTMTMNESTRDLSRTISNTLLIPSTTYTFSKLLTFYECHLPHCTQFDELSSLLTLVSSDVRSTSCPPSGLDPS